MTEKPHYYDHRQRLKDKYKSRGRNAFADYEILELLLTYAIPRKDVKPIAKDLINKFGSLRNVFDQSIEELEKVSGIGDSSSILLKLIKDLTILYFEPDMNKKIFLSSPEAVSEFLSEELSIILDSDTQSYLQAELGDQGREFFMILCLNSANQLIHKEILFSGTVDQAQVYPREIVKIALLKNATSVILVHNHPSGNSKPSRDDIFLTERLEDIAKEFNIRIHDHIVVSKEKVFSIKANRFLS